MTQEEYMDVLAMKRRGMSLKEIGDELGYHPATMPSGSRPVVRHRRTVDEADRVIGGVG